MGFARTFSVNGTLNYLLCHQKKAIKNIIKKGLLLIVPVYLLWFMYIQFMPNYYNRPNNTRWQFIKESL